jgi:predicted GNAT superfamily acetyltransferase
VDNLSAAGRPSPTLAMSATAAGPAHELAAAHARRARVVLCELSAGAEFTAASALLARVWGTSSEAAPLPADLLASFVHAGSCVRGARDDDQLVGLAVCLAGAPRSPQVYSLIAAVDARVAGRGVGGALKFGQRAWALDRGADQMVWTFDPLVRRNAHFNLTKLGARAVAYLPDFYPPMHDTINRQDLTDRLVAAWDLAEPVPEPGAAPMGAGEAVTMVGVDDAQRPVLRDPGGAERLTVAAPDDVERLRRSDAALARQWRVTVRQALTSTLSDGYRITGFARDAYLLQRGPHD